MKQKKQLTNSFVFPTTITDHFSYYRLVTINFPTKIEKKIYNPQSRASEKKYHLVIIHQAKLIASSYSVKYIYEHCTAGTKDRSLAPSGEELFLSLSRSLGQSVEPAAFPIRTKTRAILAGSHAPAPTSSYIHIYIHNLRACVLYV